MTYKNKDEYDIISFGSGSQIFYELSPFYFCTFEASGKKWRTLIHYWVASYFKKDSYMTETIRGLSTPQIAMNVAKKHGFLDFNQTDPKDLIYAIQERFNQNDGLRMVLLSTGSAYLKYSGSGYLAEENRYGKLLMKVREIYADK